MIAGVALALTLLLLLWPLPALAGQDTEAIARALEKRLNGALVEGSLEPGDFLELRLYEKEKAEGYDFRVNFGRKGDKFLSRWTITDGLAIQKSYLIGGVGAARLYADTGFQVLADTIGSDHFGATRITRTLVFGAIELCPGVAFFPKTRYGGDSFTQIVCRPEPGKSYCLTPARDWTRTARSLRMNAIIKEVRLYAASDCQGPFRPYFSSHEIADIALTGAEKQRIVSFRVQF